MNRLANPTDPARVVFRTSEGRQIVITGIIAFIAFILMGFVNHPAYFFIAALFLFIVPPMALFWHIRVTVTPDEIEVTRFLVFKSRVRWNEIKRIKSNYGESMKLIDEDGKSVSINARVKGFHVIVEILRKTRPDLFRVQSEEPGRRVFKRNALKTYGSYGLWIALILFSIFVMFKEGISFITVLLIVVSVLVLMFGISSVGEVIIESDQLIIIKGSQKKVFQRDEIHKIKFDVTNFTQGFVERAVEVHTERGIFRLEGFSGGSEILYGSLMEWWQSGAYRPSSANGWSR